MVNQLKLIERATSIHYRKKLLFGIEETIQNWIHKKGLPYRVDRVEFNPWTATIYLKSRDINYPDHTFTLQIK